MLKQRNFIKPAFVCLVTSLLIACGGGGTEETVQTVNEPIQITPTSWNSPLLTGRNTSVAVTSSLSSNKVIWSIVVKGVTLTSKSHLQLYLDIDNNPSTGFQFDSQVWSQHSGADYLIEDEILFKSVRNDSTWKWEKLEKIEANKTTNTITIKVPVVNFSGLCKKYNIGVIGLNKDWDIESYYPQSNSMAPRTIDYCDTSITNKRPVITINNSSTLVIKQNNTFTVPKATATDPEDGDISDKIEIDHNVDTKKVGLYSITYSVKDSKNLYAIPVTRRVMVESKTSNIGITIDGQNNDWATTVPFAASSGHTFKINDDKNTLFLAIESGQLDKNTQFFFDTDNNASTGFGLDSGSADYMIENGELYKFTGVNKNHWSWNPASTTIFPYIKNQNIIELSIPKGAFDNLKPTIKLMFFNFDKNWKVKYTLADELKQYSFQNSLPKNFAPIAIADSASTTNTIPTLIDILSNDSDADNDPLSIASIVQPAHGTAVVKTAKIQYTANSNFVGTDSFNYTISDGKGHTATATVTIAVTAGVNQAPDAVEDAVSTSYNTAIEINVLENDTDLNQDTLSILSFTQPSLGTTTKLNNGNILFDPKGNIGSISFSYTATDGNGGTDTAVVTIATFDPNDSAHSDWPVISDEAITVKSGKTILIDVLANDTDADGDTLILDQVDDPHHGSIVKINGKVQYTANAGYTGSDIFWYGVHDGYGHNGAGKVTITVTP